MISIVPPRSGERTPTVARVPGEWFEWEWDETLFAGAAPYYSRDGSRTHPDSRTAFRSAFALDGRGRLLDVGCGPGTVTLLLAPLFAQVVGLDPDRGMIAEAQRLASEQDIENAQWVVSRAEDITADLGRFRVVTFAASFHWMVRETVASIALDLLDPKGVVVHVDNRHQECIPCAGAPMPPNAEIDELRRSYLGNERRAGRSLRISSPSGEETVFRNAGFTGPEVVDVPDGREITRTIDDVVAETFSMSSSTPHLFGDRLAAFEADLRNLLADPRRDGEFCVRLPDNRLNIWRPERR